MTAVTIHSLANKDLSTMTGECSVCGLVAIRKAGRGFQCSVKKASGQRAWREANPEKVAANRRLRSPHQLFGHDYPTLAAKCVICGPVDIVLWGRGYACGNRARELRTVQQTSPQKHCSSCWAESAGDARRTKVYLRADGSCPRCDDPATADLGAQLREMEYGYRHSKEMGQVPEGMHVAYEDDDPYFMEDYASAVPGWKTLGSSRPWNEV